MSLTILLKFLRKPNSMSLKLRNCIMYLDSAKVSESEQLDFQFEIEN
jgi:hypothetical protein